MADRPTPSCLVCGDERLVRFLDLGETALANKFLLPDELEREEPRYPLVVAFCETCHHVQLADRVPPAAMFTDYLYMSSISETLDRHFRDLSSTLVDRLGLGADDLVVDIGCNDASLLRGFRDLGVGVLGVDPAENLARQDSSSGIERHVGFFGAQSALEIVDRRGPASLITATNTFPHIPELGDFMTGIASTLRPDGTFVVEAHYLLDILDQLAFDTVYHEHVSYWALGPMMRLFEAHGLEVVDAERLPIHHGQLRVTAKLAGTALPSPRVAEVLAEEKRHRIDDLATFETFAERVYRVRTDLLAVLDDLRRDGRRLAAYGAPAKGSTLLEFLGLGSDDLEFIVDRSDLKKGRYTPGSHIPIVDPRRLLDDRIDCALLLAWNFVDEIVGQQKEFLARGGRFILPIPDVRLVPPRREDIS